MAEKLQIIIDVDGGKATTQLKKVEKNLKAVDKEAKVASGGISSMTKALGGLAVGAAAVSALRKVMEVGRSFDIINSSLKTVTGSTEAAAAAFTMIETFAAKTPFDLEQVANAFIKMKALGLDPSEEALTSYGNTASAMGKDLNQMIEAVADAATGEFERLKEFGIRASSQGDQVSFTFRGITKTVGKNSKEIEDYLKNIGNTDFAGAMADRAATLDGALSNLGDSWDGLFRTMSEAGIGALMKDAANATSDMIQEISYFYKVVFGNLPLLEENALKIVELGDSIAETERLIKQGEGLNDNWLGLNVSDVEARKAKLAELRGELVAYTDARTMLLARPDPNAPPKDPKDPKGDKPLTDAQKKSAAASAARMEEEMIAAYQHNADMIQGAQDYFAQLDELAMQRQMTDEEREIDAFNRKLERIEEQKAIMMQYGVDEASAEAEALLARENAEIESMARISEARQKDAEEAIKIASDKAAAEAKIEKLKSDVIGGIANAAAAMMQSKSRAAFEIGKTASLAIAGIKTYEAAQNAYASASAIPVVGWLAAPIAAAAAVAAGISNMQKIQSTTFGGGASVSGGSASAPQMPSATNPTAPTEPYQKADTQQGGTTVHMTLQALDPSSVSEDTMQAIGDKLAPALADSMARGREMAVTA